VTTEATYDAIGRSYVRYRQPDPRIACQIEAALGNAQLVLNVGAGTGSYEANDRRVVAVEPSPVMLAQRSSGAAPAVRGVAGALPFGDGSFDAAMAILTVHHWPDAAAGLAELRRVADGIVVFTFDAAIHAQYWLFEEYLPETVTLDTWRTPPIEAVAEAVDADRVEVVPIPADCVDGFNWAYWRRPESYLDPGVRSCISGLAQLPDDLVASRMQRLAADLADGTWQTRHAELARLDAVDGGFRLVVRSGRQ
jgi:SAM-dependent methyltransferase